MTALEKIIAWIATYPGYDILSSFQVDYTDKVPNNGGVYPAGLVEIERRSSIMGVITVTNQYNFGLYYVFAKAPEDDIGASINADWIMDFQEWVQEQSVTGQAPTFGDVPREEKIMAQNGVMYETEGKEGVATYMVQLSVQFKKIYEVKNEWLT